MLQTCSGDTSGKLQVMVLQVLLSISFTRSIITNDSAERIPKAVYEQSGQRSNYMQENLKFSYSNKSRQILSCGMVVTLICVRDEPFYDQHYMINQGYSEEYTMR